MKNACQFSQETANKKRLYGIEAGPSSEAGMLTLSLPEIIVDTKAEIEELTGALGLMVMKACIQDEVRRLVGDRYEHVEGRRCARWGSQRGAVGVDGKSSEEYEKSLQSNILKLLNEAKGGTYYAPPVRRVYIPKGEGKEARPLGIPTFEDKVLQRGAAMLLESVYEQDFLDCSYGFRPGRSAHDAVRRFHQTMMSMGGAFVIKVDIRKYFDTVDHAKLREILGERIRDGVLTRLIGKWLSAGVLDDGQRHYPDAGTPQGGVISKRSWEWFRQLLRRYPLPPPKIKVCLYAT